MNNKIMVKNLKDYFSPSGQIVLILLLVITIGLGVGLSVIQRSISDVSTSTRVEESSRAFSAAEAGIEDALIKISRGENPNSTTYTFAQNQSNYKIENASGSIPAAHQIFESSAVPKGNNAQVWLADPNVVSAIPTQYYNQPGIDIYWGSTTVTTKPAIEISVIFLQGGEIKRKTFYLDPDVVRASGNGFCYPGSSAPSCTGAAFICSGVSAVDTSLGPVRSFACKAQLSGLGAVDLGSGRVLLLVRARVFYVNFVQPVAFGPQGGICGNACSFPPQATLVVSTGTSGVTQRTVQLYRYEKNVPEFLDYAIFSMADIVK